jgi:hypothetical protein
MCRQPVSTAIIAPVIAPSPSIISVKKKEAKMLEKTISSTKKKVHFFLRSNFTQQ